MNTIYRDAILMASKIRNKLKVGKFQPLNIYDCCLALEVDVKFVDINMEGFYVKQRSASTILVSNQRPFPRRCFTTAHELGHHVFGHGLKVDILSDDRGYSISKDKNEILVDAFAAYFLMPVGGIQASFIKRNWTFEKACPADFYTISSEFGTGYHTLVVQCEANSLINHQKATDLLKATPAKILQSQFSGVVGKSYFRIIDQHTQLSAIDLEVSNYLILPQDMEVEKDYLEKVAETGENILFIARKAGITSIYSSDGLKSYFIRIQKANYIGFAEYRHLED